MKKKTKTRKVALRVAQAVADHDGATSRQLELDLGSHEMYHALAAAERRGLIRREVHVYLTPAGDALVRGERKAARAAGSVAEVVTRRARSR